jgi:hypothetical protein
LASAASWFEVEPLQQLLERDRRRGDGVAQRLSITLSSLTLARAPAPMNRGLRLARRVDSGLARIEKTAAKGIRAGDRIDSGLSGMAELAGSLGEALGEGTALGKLAQQIGAGLGKGQQMLHDALEVARDGHELLEAGHDLLHRALEAAGDREPVGELLDALAPDTWIGSGEGTQDFSDVFGPFLPAEGAIVRGERQASDSKGSFVDLFEHLEGFAGSAEKFLDDLGLHELAGAAAKGAAAADWAKEKAEVVRRAAKTADRWMETLNLGRPPADFRLAAEGESRSVPPRDQAGGKDAPPDGEALLEEVSGRVYDLLMDDLEQAFESR